ncbi:MAG: SNF2-related protein [Geminicoccaceae bacterium]
MSLGQAPSWMKKGTAGINALSNKDKEPFKKEHVAPAFNSKVYGDVLTSDQAIALGEEAIETVQWNLRSDPYGVQAYTLLRAKSPIPGVDTTPIRGFGFFLEQGLGKTKTTLADFWNLYNAGFNDCMVVVTVNSMKATWKREMEDEHYPFDIHVWPDFKKLPSKTKGQIVIINYEALFRRGGDMLLQWMRRGRPYLAFDESTSLMNHKSQQSKAGVLLSTMAIFQRCLAGKPNPMGPHNLWPQLKVLGAPVGNAYAFRNTFCVMGGFQARKVTGQKNIERLVELMKPRTFFADKKTWAPTLPEKKNATLVCDMSEPQKKAYKTMANELYAEIQGGEAIVEIEHTLHKSMKLQQIASGFIYDEHHKTHKIGEGEPGKLTLIKDFVANATGKTIIFAHFTPTVRMLMEAFPGAPYALSKSLMSSDELEANKARFNSDDCMMPFIASSSVLKFGHTLVGTPTNPCQSVLFCENTYSLLTRSQAEDRAHRWGAEADIVTYYDIICSPVDRDMVRALRNREDLAQALLGALKGFTDD